MPEGTAGGPQPCFSTRGALPSQRAGRMLSGALTAPGPCPSKVVAEVLPHVRLHVHHALAAR